MVIDFKDEPRDICYITIIEKSNWNSICGTQLRIANNFMINMVIVNQTTYPFIETSLIE